MTTGPDATPTVRDGNYLGYDASCGQCSEIATVLHSELGDRVTVMPLRSDSMQNWRRELLGDNAKWGPTLVTVKNGEPVRGKVGWKMGPALTKSLGVVAALRALSVIGGNQMASKSPAGRPSNIPLSHLTRKSFMFGSSVVVAAGILAGRPTKAYAGTKQRSTTVETARELSNTELVDTAKEHLNGGDVGKVAAAASLSPALSTYTVGSIPSSAIVPATESTGEPHNAGETLEVYAAKTRHKNGIEESVVIFYCQASGTLVVSKIRSGSIDGVQTYAHRMAVEDLESDNGPNLKTISWSVNGAQPRMLAETEQTYSAKDDPCGGCSGGPGNPNDKMLNNLCEWEASFKCIKTAAGCATCVSCGGWFSCLSCGLTSCVPIVEDCCNDRPACVDCPGQT